MTFHWNLLFAFWSRSFFSKEESLGRVKTRHCNLNSKQTVRLNNIIGGSLDTIWMSCLLSYAKNTWQHCSALKNNQDDLHSWRIAHAVSSCSQNCQRIYMQFIKVQLCQVSKWSIIFFILTRVNCNKDIDTWYLSRNVFRYKIQMPFPLSRYISWYPYLWNTQHWT